MEEAVEQFNVKMSKMASQKAEIQGNVKKLQGLTVDYSRMLESEGRAKEMQDQIRDTEQHIDLKMQKLEQERAKHRTELDQLKELRAQLTLSQEQVYMQKEDYDGWLMREKDRIADERDLVH